MTVAREADGAGAATSPADQGMLLAWWAARQPDVPAVVSPSGQRSFKELNERANQLARALRRLGLRAGDGVALLCGNRPEFVEVAAACQRAGWRLTTVNWHLTAAEAGYIVDDCEAKALVADAGFAETAGGAAATARGCTVRLSVCGPIEGFLSYDRELAGESNEDIEDPCLGSSMLYTSGTTGRPKGVYRSEPAPSAASLNLFGYRDDGTDRHLCTGPLYHAAPLAFSLTTPLTHGAGVVLMERWDAAEALRLVEAQRITHTHMVPTMFHRLLSLPTDVREAHDTSSLRSVLHGAAPCPVPVKRRLIAWLGPIVWEYYAATEGSACFVDSRTWLAHPGTVGKPADGQVRIGDETGVEVPPGSTGLVYIRAPKVGRFEYFKDPAKTTASYRGDYFTLGDIGHVDEEGYLYITDRSADVIISGGVNVYPAEIDAVLLEHPAVGDVAVIGEPDPEGGERVLAVVELQPGHDRSVELAAELIEHCRTRLAGYKCPDRVDFVDELPRQDNGKIYRRTLRDRYRAQARSKSSGGGQAHTRWRSP
ncbi:MAG TPA: AMP-binding protein [Acidimicrobiales bacterium]|nr:AMP-binding protein [Acidimicrobiales bacterium]